MSISYSKSTNGFYAKEIHGKNIPSDAVEITAEKYAELLAGQTTGKIITADSNGAPILQDPPALTATQQWAAYQAKAKAALTDSDTSMLRIYEAVILGATSMDAADVVAFVKWRQEVRAILSATQPETRPVDLPAMPVYPAGTESAA